VLIEKGASLGHHLLPDADYTSILSDLIEFSAMIRTGFNISNENALYSFAVT
jgi:hypothetical protein